MRLSFVLRRGAQQFKQEKGEVNQKKAKVAEKAEQKNEVILPRLKMRGEIAAERNWLLREPEKIPANKLILFLGGLCC